MRNKIYQYLVNRVPAIQKRYHAIRQQRKGKLGRFSAWLDLLGMNVAYLFGKRKFGQDYLHPDETKRLPKDFCESGLSKREAPEELAKRLLQYDVISFDVFDTLIYRPVSAPTDLFFFVGVKLGYLDFERLRRDMEWRARQKAYEQTQTYEVTLEDIYVEMEEQIGIPKEKGMQTEIETELSYCFGNPYMLKVFEYLQNKGKTIVCTSDMYLSSDTIRRMIENAGYKGIVKYFVSCEEMASKGNGKLFAKVKKAFGEEKTYVHVGDHPVSDGEQAKKAGFHAEHYGNANIVGMPYRAEDLSLITGSVYRGIVNAHIHNGLEKFSPEYELGFTYAGFFVLGYCKWIHQYVKEHKIDKILFLARDGDILCRAYRMLYPNEATEDKTTYVYWSRLAATKLGADYFKYDYFRRFLDHKVNQKYTMEKIFKAMGLEDLLPQVIKKLPDFMDKFVRSDKMFGVNDTVIANVKKEAKITEKTYLTTQNVWMLKEYLIAHWSVVLAHYAEEQEAAKAYYQNAIGNAKTVVAVDIGWAGSGAVVLKHLIENEWKLGCNLKGLIAGTNTIHNAEPNMSESLLMSGDLESYLYSQTFNRDLWKFHDPGKDHNLYWEALLESTEPTFKGFHWENGQNGTREVGFEFGKKDGNQEGIVELQKGILDFVTWFQDKAPNLENISGSDVYQIMLFLQEKNRGCVEKIMKSFDQVMGVE